MHFKLNNSFIGIYVILLILHNINIVFYSKVLWGWVILARGSSNTTRWPLRRGRVTFYTPSIFSQPFFLRTPSPSPAGASPNNPNNLSMKRSEHRFRTDCFYTLYYIKNYNSDKLSNSTVEKIKTVSSKIILRSILVRHFNQNTLLGPAERRKLWTNAASH